MARFVVGDKTFSSKAAATDYFKEMLGRYKDGETVSRRDEEALLDLLRLHPEASEKVGVGIRRIEVGYNPPWMTKGFRLVRTDGSVEDFSYRFCISRPVDSAKAEALAAMRGDVVGQIREFREAAYGGKKYARCVITGLNVRVSDCHIDHAPPKTFQVLVQDFLLIHGLSFGDLLVGDSGARATDCGRTLADEALRERWRSFHKENADLRVTLNHANWGQKKVRFDFRTDDVVGQADEA